jgi:RimJ/RimL family protein N-acetyltransferase
MTPAVVRLTAEEATRHLAVLDEVRFNLLVSVLARARDDASFAADVWSFGEPGACAVQGPGWPIGLGDLSQQHCTALADACAERPYPGVNGPGLTAEWFVARAGALGHRFGPPVPQRIHAISGPPRHPGAPGLARSVQEDDIPLAADWMEAFLQEALPFDTPPPRDVIERGLRKGTTWLWVLDDRPVSMAAITRRSPRAAAISHVYTPPAERGRGYAGAVTATLVELIQRDGRPIACLYTDARNPASNRCYARIGFQPVCDSHFFARQTNDK